MQEKYKFTSESVSEGHPDKICDQISDAVLDELLRSSEEANKSAVRCACEVMVKDGFIFCAGKLFQRLMTTKSKG